MPQELLDLVREIKGNRTVREMAKDTGLSTATLSKYMTGHGKGNIKIETLRKIAAEDSNPQNGVSFYDLLYAAGLDPIIMDEEQAKKAAAEKQKDLAAKYEALKKYTMKLQALIIKEHPEQEELLTVLSEGLFIGL